MLRNASGRVIARAPIKSIAGRRCVQTSGARFQQQTARGAQRNGGLLVASAAVALGSYAVYMGGKEIYNDMHVVKEVPLDPSFGPADEVKEETLHSLVWGSNRSKVLSPIAKAHDTVRTPAVASWLDGVALRDLQFHEHHAACIDARGDVYQWGEGFYGEKAKNAAGAGPELTLRGKNIIQLQLTEDKVYALSASGHIYAFSAKAEEQARPAGSPTPSSDSWWGTGWLWGEEETIDFARLTSNEKFDWKEKFTSIAAGQNHLLALTSTGRAFGHPTNKQANAYGQLGFQKFAIPDRAGQLTGGKDTHLHVELVPKSLHDPFLKASRSVRASSDSSPLPAGTQDLSVINDKSIRFCPYLYEIPVLRGVNVAQIACGARTSFARTPSGRVLGWGANEYGQLGLGTNVALDTITVPTEVILWRAVPNNVQTSCTDVTAGGDLTAFVVDRLKETESPYTELLMSGNGQYGGLGNNVFTTAQSNASRVKAVSGLKQYNDKTNTLEAIKPEEITVSPTGHVLLSINSSADSHGVGGNDVMVWGKNFDSELGNGRKSSVPVPVHLNLHSAANTTEVPEGGSSERLMLMQRKAREVRDLKGRVWKKGVRVRQQVVAGYGTSAVYWKIEE